MAVKKLIPWQDRDRIGGPQAFIRTTIEALLNPAEYFAKIQIREFYQEPLILCFYNSLFLASPLFGHVFLLSNFIGLIFIPIFVSIFIFVVALAIQYVLFWLEVETDYRKIFNVLAYSSPAFMLALVPVVGYVLSALVFSILVIVGLSSIHQVKFFKILPAVIVVPLLILLPYQFKNSITNWNKANPPVIVEHEAVNVLRSISATAEDYAAKNNHKYPVDSSFLSSQQNFCGQSHEGYRFSCQFREYGYLLKAQPEGWRGRGKRVFIVTTGGKAQVQ